MKVVEGDLTDSEDNLVEVLNKAKVDAIVIAVMGGPAVTVEGQLNLLKAAKRVGGIKRFIPSDFGFDYRPLKDGDNINLNARRTVHKALQESGIPWTSIMNGCFMNVVFGFFGVFDLKNGKAFAWGDPNTKMNTTTYADTAKFVAEVILDPTAENRYAGISGDTISIAEMVAQYEEITGKKLELEVRGTIEDLQNHIKKLQSENPTKVWVWLPFQYQYGCLSGVARIKDEDLLYLRYPELASNTFKVRDFINENLK